MAYASWSVVFGEQPSAAKWNILGTNDAWFDSLISQTASHTTIGTNDYRATRFVPLDNVQVLTTDPAGTSFTDLDVTSSTSANCYAVAGIADWTTAGTARSVQIRTNGSATTPTTLRTGLATGQSAAAFITGCDTGQIFEWAVTNADVTNLTITLTGYWEYVD